MIAPWLQRHLEAAGRWNTDGIGRDLSAGRCHRCQAQVVRGLDDDRLGIPTTCDPQPVDRLGEALALMGDRRTFNLVHRDGRWRLDTRDAYRIAAMRGDAVLAEHRCHAPPLPTTELPNPEPARPTGDPTW